jgi:hypothetical protein
MSDPKHGFVPGDEIAVRGFGFSRTEITYKVTRTTESNVWVRVESTGKDRRLAADEVRRARKLTVNDKRRADAHRLVGKVDSMSRTLSGLRLGFVSEMAVNELHNAVRILASAVELVERETKEGRPSKEHRSVDWEAKGRELEGAQLSPESNAAETAKEMSDG